MTDPLGNVSGGNTAAHTTHYTYNTWDEMTGQFQPVPVSGEGPSDEPATLYAYDDMGKQTSVTDPDGNVTSFAFN